MACSKHTCPICLSTFTRAHNLRSHLLTHINQRPWTCSTCGKAFTRKNDCLVHEKLHSGKKEHVCRGVNSDGSEWGCGRGFSRRTTLKRHWNSEGGRLCHTTRLKTSKEVMSLNYIIGSLMDGHCEQSVGWDLPTFMDEDLQKDEQSTRSSFNSSSTERENKGDDHFLSSSTSSQPELSLDEQLRVLDDTLGLSLETPEKSVEVQSMDSTEHYKKMLTMHLELVELFQTLPNPLRTNEPLSGQPLLDFLRAGTRSLKELQRTILEMAQLPIVVSLDTEAAKPAAAETDWLFLDIQVPGPQPTPDCSPTISIKSID